MSIAVCGGAVDLFSASRGSLGWDVPREDDNVDLVLWSYGMHPVDWTHTPPSTGPGNAMNFVRGKCAGWSSEFQRKVVWLSMHAGLYTRKGGAQNPYAWRLAHNGHAWRRAFATRMERALRAECGVEGFVDVLEPTVKAVLQVPRIFELTHDGQHWGPEINLAKVLMLWPHLLAAARRTGVPRG
ncbi:hypothetical protein T484DRAFT_1886123, partial [Baffinella frigidus]